jgi:hypothetical protein
MNKKFLLRQNLLSAVVVVAAVALAACSSSEPAKTTEAAKTDEAAKKPAGPADPVTGKTAFYEMYTPAHAWAADILPLSLKSGQITGVKNTDGKAGMWTAVFGSASQHSARTYTYAVADQLPSIPKGVKSEGTEAWAGPTANVMTFQTADFTVDSDAAYKTAAEKAGDWLKKPENAAKPVSLSLGAASRFPAPVWYILFGDQKDGFVALINASTGNVVTK